MQRWLIALAMAVMLGLGFVAGSLITRAHADTNKEGSKIDPFVVIPLNRVDKSDPIAIRYDTRSGNGTVIGIGSTNF